MDRNLVPPIFFYLPVPSLSARRAWIEIWVTPLSIVDTPVALRKESVDRNSTPKNLLVLPCVALRKESVDRNWPDGVMHWMLIGRSPQGERG